MSHLFKNALTNYAQKRNILFPTYACEMQGPSHARLFKARVTIGGVTYEGPDFCTTLKDAEHAAAKVAFVSLSRDGTQEDDFLYTSLLQELAQKKGRLLPVYATNITGQSRSPSFVSIVEVAGEYFVGQEARTKKQAEMNAAKVAYTALAEGGPRANSAIAFSDLQMVGTSSLGPPSLQSIVNTTKETTPILATSKIQTNVDGVTYEGPEFCTTLKDAEHEAAKVAFMSSPDGRQEDDCLYKSLLQELAQKKRRLLPVYATNITGPSHSPSFVSTVEVAGEHFVGQEARTKKHAERNAAKVAYTALVEGGPRANNAAAFSDLQMVGTSSLGPPSLQTVVNTTKETASIPATSKIQTTINNQASSIAKETEKAKAPSEEVQKRTMILPPVGIHQSQPKVTPNVGAAELNIGQENLATQPTQAREECSSNEIKSQVMESGAARPYKILIRPHVQGMSYDGPILVSDEEWVAMKVNV